ncbi:MAG: hypothetical protein ACI4XE_02760, partial [Acutalibacteraceae bacterium]
LMNTAAAEGNLNFPKDGSKWFAIGCDAGPTAQLGWIGDVAVARVYDEVLSEEQIALLSDEFARMNCYAVPDLVTEVSYVSGLTVKVGGKYTIGGNGFAEGDQIKFVSVADESQSLTVAATSPALLEREWYGLVDMSKYCAFIINTLNHDESVSVFLDPIKKIHDYIDRYHLK